MEENKQNDQITLNSVIDDNTSQNDQNFDLSNQEISSNDIDKCADERAEEKYCSLCKRYGVDEDMRVQLRDNFTSFQILIEDFEDYFIEFLDRVTFLCNECGRRFYNSSFKLTSDGYICEDCFENYYFRCDRCGSIERISGRNNVDDEEWCDHCFNNHTTWCVGCNCYHDEDITFYTINDNNYCKRYCESNFRWCDNCRNYVDDDDFNFDYDCCNSCAEEENGYGKCSLIKGYHCSPTTRYFGRENRNKKYKYNTIASIGTELEIDRKDYKEKYEKPLVEKLLSLVDSERDELYFERDGSLDCGFEIITQPHTYESFMEMNWKEILKSCSEFGYISHDSDNCGLHMHISRDFFGRDEVKQNNAIAKVVNFFETNYFEIIKVSRRQSGVQCHWARKYNNYGNVTKDDCIKISKKYKYGGSHDERYKAVNLTNTKTVEFRIMRGTLNYNTFIACIDFLYRIAMNSKYISWKDIHKTNLWFKGMRKETLEYVKSRDAFTDVIEYIEQNNNINKSEEIK